MDDVLVCNWFTANLINEYNQKIECLIKERLPLFFQDEAVIKICTYDTEALEEIISKKGYEIDRKLNEEGLRLIFIAIAFRATLCLQIILKYGANPNTPLTNKCTPIRYAARFQFFEAIDLLGRHKDFQLTPDDVCQLKTMVNDKVDCIQNKMGASLCKHLTQSNLSCNTRKV